MQQLNLAIFAGGLSWPVYIARDKRFFAKSGLNVHITEVSDSVAQITGLVNNTYHIAMTPFDNAVAYEESQGEVMLDHDPGLFAFMGGISSSLRLLARHELRSLDGLKGSTIGVDAEHTGYTLAMYELLENHNVPLGTYSLSRTGGTTHRVEALAKGNIAATMVSSPQEIVPESQGFRRLGDVQTMIGPYQAVCGVACRSWAAHSGDILRAYIKAYVEASDWLSDQAHLDEACTIFTANIPGTSNDLAQQAWKLMVGGPEGFQPQAEFSPEGAETVLRMRLKYGRPRKPLANWTKYFDGSFYSEAVDRHNEPT